MGPTDFHVFIICQTAPSGLVYMVASIPFTWDWMWTPNFAPSVASCHVTQKGGKKMVKLMYMVWQQVYTAAFSYFLYMGAHLGGVGKR